MLAASRNYLYRAPWYGIAPGLAISLFLLGLNTRADGLRAAIDPTQVRGMILDAECGVRNGSRLLT